MNQRLNLVFFLLQFSILAAQVQPGVLQGVVLDSRSKKPVSDVLVSCGAFLTHTNQEGMFHLIERLQDSIIRFNLVGYEEYAINLSEISKGPVLLTEKFLLLSTTVVSASKYERPIAESTVSMSVVGKELPNRLNSLSGEKALDRISGVQIIDGQANIRGGSGYSYGAGSRVMLLMDDLPMMQQDAANPYWNDLPFESIGQIEVIKGAASALYGSSAMNGVVHFRSVTPGLEPYTSITATSGIYLKPGNGKEWWGKNGELSLPFENYYAIVHRRKKARWDYSLNSSFDHKKGFNKDNNSENFRLNGIFRYRLTDSLLLSLGLNANGGSSSDFFYWLDNGLYQGAESAATRSDKLRFTIDPKLSYHDRKGFHHKLLGRYYNIFNGADNNQENKSHHAYLEYQLRKNLKVLKIDLQAGAVWNATWTKAQLYSDTSFSLGNQSLFLQLERRFGKRFILNAGIRYERYESNGPGLLGGEEVARKTDDDRFIYRAGLNYNIWNAGYLRMSVGEGFRFPSLAEKYIETTAGGLRIVPNTKLESEHGWNYELGLRQGWLIGNIKGMIDLAYFDSRYYDMMEFVLNNQLQFQSRNIGNTQISGFEVEFYINQSLLNFNWTLSGGYTRIDPKYREFDLSGKQLAINEREFGTIGQQNAANSSSFENILKYRSKDLLRMDFQLDFSGFYMGYAFQYVSHVEAIDWLFQVTLFIKGINDFRQIHDHGYRIHDFRVGTNWGPWNLQLNVNNLTNEIYTTRPGLMEAPRNMSLKIVYTL
ncbi:MAG: TonB-dependent receptor [Saprospiraceae bacterium]|nr:TonB-dependent receptor [Saprospiraceae bacterium]